LGGGTTPPVRKKKASTPPNPAKGKKRGKKCKRTSLKQEKKKNHLTALGKKARGASQNKTLGKETKSKNGGKFTSRFLSGPLHASPEPTRKTRNKSAGGGKKFGGKV